VENGDHPSPFRRRFFRTVFFFPKTGMDEVVSVARLGVEVYPLANLFFSFLSSFYHGLKGDRVASHYIPRCGRIGSILFHCLFSPLYSGAAARISFSTVFFPHYASQDVMDWMKIGKHRRNSFIEQSTSGQPPPPFFFLPYGDGTSDAAFANRPFIND